MIMAKSKKAPARAKAIEDNYLLTTKIYCGDCNSAVTGVSGTSQTGAFYQYYQCNTSRHKGDCKKKAVRKTYIEDAVINKTISFLTPENIDMLARSIEDRCEKERNTEDLKRISKLLRKNETATGNLVKALEAGKAVDIISAQIEKRQAEKADLEAQLAMEKIQRPELKYDQLKFFFERFAKGDVNDINYRRALVDIFINRIYLYDDHMKIVYNAQDMGQMVSPICEPKEISGSYMGRLAEGVGFEPTDGCPSPDFESGPL